MASFINTNMVSLNTQNNLSKSQDALAQSIKRLSTGLRINSSKDDAAGLAISNRMDATIRGQTVAIRNTNDAVSFSQTADGALGQINNNLQRLRELAVQASNGTNSAGDRELLNTEFNQLQQEVIRIKNNTAFNGTNAMQENSVTVQIGAGTTQYDKVKINGIDLTQVTAATTTDLMTSNSFSRAQYDKAIAALKADGADERAKNIHFNEATGHVYEMVKNNASYETAQDNAESLSFGGQTGYLATIGNAEENQFVNLKAQNNETWINGAQGLYTGTKAPETGALAYTNFSSDEKASDFSAVAIGEDGVWSNSDNVSGKYSMVEYGGRQSTELVATQRITTIFTDGETLGTYRVNTGSVVIQDNSSDVVADKTLFLDRTGASIAEGTELTAGMLFYIKTTGHAGVDGATDTYGDNDSFREVNGATKVTSDVQQAFSSSLAAFGNSSGVNILTQADALNAIDSLDKAMLQVNVAQIQQGATQNRLSAIINSLTSNNESTINARSHIMDTDFAAETASMARAQILQQAGMAMLAQANTSNNGIMALMR